MAGFLFAMAAGTFLAFWPASQPMLIGLAIVSMGVGTLSASEARRRRRLIAQRGAESSLCAFARAFDARRTGTDTHLIRAVYEELGQLLAAGRQLFPVRATDRLFDHHALDLDDDDVDDVLEVVAARAGRSLLAVEQNPWYGRIETVAGLVHFLNAQPRSI